MLYLKTFKACPTKLDYQLFKNGTSVNAFKLKSFSRNLKISSPHYFTDKSLISNKNYSIFNYNKVDKVQHTSSCFHNKKFLPSYVKAQEYLNNPAVHDQFNVHTYKDLIYKANQLSSVINSKVLPSNSSHIRRQKVSALLCPNDSRYVISMWGSWMAGCLVVPLSIKHPENLLNYFLQDCSADLLLTIKEYGDLAEKLTLKNSKLQIIHMDDLISNTNLHDNGIHDNRIHDVDQPALVVYTSGTTGNPKGAIHTHRTITTMVNGMIDRWGWSQSDVILHALPLNHIHGIINALLTPLTSGASCVMLPKFDPKVVWNYILETEGGTKARNTSELFLRPPIPKCCPNIFMGVPTMYNMLIDHQEEKIHVEKRKSGCTGELKLKERVKQCCLEKIRLFISGSAPLPQPIISKWEELTGHVLLERYGMTELGMVFTNPVLGRRTPGYVGRPFPMVEVAVAKNNNQSKSSYEILALGNENGTKVLIDNDNKSDDDDDDENGGGGSGVGVVVGELLVKGGTVFKGYLNKVEATSKAFTEDGWFITGDTVSYDQSNDSYKILGRTSVDVIKHGGFKLSALEIENYLLNHPSFKEVAVLGVKDEKWGQKVVALVTLNNRDVPIVFEDVKRWCGLHMAKYQIPSEFKVVDDLMRNTMGKINKKQLLHLYFNE